ncbi:hypothetical protein D9758_014549 [Tetrapyrgos nigripes]|uniref:Uncharacterized protein n=1 Tax=Tetrapyrgos nigripes TaxID=182062 RepID=A0A8H5FL96_9AGAR|nr:hypothetical protein D9758_014549 [Tetrapyrgos nigripes]
MSVSPIASFVSVSASIITSEISTSFLINLMMMQYFDELSGDKARRMTRTQGPGGQLTSTIEHLLNFFGTGLTLDEHEDLEVEHLDPEQQVLPGLIAVNNHTASKTDLLIYNQSDLQNSAGTSPSSTLTLSGSQTPARTPSPRKSSKGFLFYITRALLLFNSREGIQLSVFGTLRAHSICCIACQCYFSPDGYSQHLSSESKCQGTPALETVPSLTAVINSLPYISGLEYYNSWDVYPEWPVLSYSRCGGPHIYRLSSLPRMRRL